MKKEYQERNKEKMAAKCKNWRVANRERYNNYHRLYQKNNEKIKA